MKKSLLIFTISTFFFVTANPGFAQSLTFGSEHDDFMENNFNTTHSGETLTFGSDHDRNDSSSSISRNPDDYPVHNGSTGVSADDYFGSNWIDRDSNDGISSGSGGDSQIDYSPDTELTFGNDNRFDIWTNPYFFGLYEDVSGEMVAFNPVDGTFVSIEELQSSRTSELFNILRTHSDIDGDDIIGYHRQIDDFESGENTNNDFSQESKVLHALTLGNNGYFEWDNIVDIKMNRTAPAEAYALANSASVPRSVALAARISIHGTEVTPQIVMNELPKEDDLATHVTQIVESDAGAIAYLSFEAVTPAFANDPAVIMHEGFHHALRAIHQEAHERMFVNYDPTVDNEGTILALVSTEQLGAFMPTSIRTRYEESSITRSPRYMLNNEEFVNFSVLGRGVSNAIRDEIIDSMSNTFNQVADSQINILRNDLNLSETDAAEVEAEIDRFVNENPDLENLLENVSDFIAN